MLLIAANDCPCWQSAGAQTCHNGKVDGRALQLWDTRTQRNGSEKLSPAAKARDRREVLPSAEQLRTVIDALPEDQIPGIDVSRERRAHYQAELSRLETLKLRGELLVADDVKRAAFEQGRMIRDNLLALPHQLAPQIAAMTDAREIHLLLTAEFSKALQMLPKE